MQETVTDHRSRMEPLAISIGLRRQACEAIKRAITEMNIYGHPLEIRLDERQLSQDLGMSRTPIREALSVLEQDGLRPIGATTRPVGSAQVQARGGRDDHRLGGDREHGRTGSPRRVVTEAELTELHALVDVFQEDPSEQISEYSQANMAFHKAIIRMGGVELMTGLTDNLFIHMRAVRAVTMTQDNRAQRSIVDHRNIIAALERHDADLAERLVREHTMGLAEHVEQHGDFLDRMAGADDERRRQYA